MRARVLVVLDGAEDETIRQDGLSQESVARSLERATLFALGFSFVVPCELSGEPVSGSLRPTTVSQLAKKNEVGDVSADKDCRKDVLFFALNSANTCASSSELS